MWLCHASFEVSRHPCMGCVGVMPACHRSGHPFMRCGCAMPACRRAGVPPRLDVVVTYQPIIEQGHPCTRCGCAKPARSGAAPFLHEIWTCHVLQTRRGSPAIGRSQDRVPCPGCDLISQKWTRCSGRLGQQATRERQASPLKAGFDCEHASGCQGLSILTHLSGAPNLR